MNTKDYSKVFRKLGISPKDLPAYTNPQDFSRNLKRHFSVVDKRDLVTRFRTQDSKGEK